MAEDKAGETTTSTGSSNDASSTFGPPPAIVAPSGGGTLRSMGDSFAMNNSTGTGSYSIPIKITAGRNDFPTSLSLRYSTGQGNGSFGIGWSHSFEQAITRKTNPSLPRYIDDDDSDVFVHSTFGDLVPCLERQGREVGPVFVKVPDKYTVKQYRPRFEQSFSRIELWTSVENRHDSHWRVFSPDNELSIYGRNTDSRISFDQSSSRTFSWLLSEEYNCYGNVRQFFYKAEDDSNIDFFKACESNRNKQVRSRMRYLKKVCYGNRQPVAMGSLTNGSKTSFMFEIIFDYGEHDQSVPTTEEKNPWSARKDPYSSYRSGYEVRCYRVCMRILMFHHIPEELGCSDYLIHSTDLMYHESVHCYKLKSVQSIGYIASPQLRPSDTPVAVEQYEKQGLPPLQFEYTRGVTKEELQAVQPKYCYDIESFSDIASLGSSTVSWVDIMGEGIPSVLITSGDEWYLKQNLSAASRSRQSTTVANTYELRLSALKSIPIRPSLRGQNVSLQDVGANGSLDLLCQDDTTQGFFKSRAPESRTGEDLIVWDEFKLFSQYPNFDSATFVRHLDMTGDGTADALVFANNELMWYRSLGETGYDPPSRVVVAPGTLDSPVVLLSQEDQSIYLADMSGDGLSDLVQIRNGLVRYWPNTGNGTFGEAVHMDASPVFDDDAAFSPTKLYLGDIDGSGTTDLVYNRDGIVTIYLNESGNGFSTPIALSTMIPHTQNHTLSMIDLFGNGTSCLVWSSDLPSHQGQTSLQYIDLTKGLKPHLLCKASNGLGAVSEFSYAPSTSYYLRDKMSGSPWLTRLPFPVHCVDTVAKTDLITGRKFVQRFSYHHGAYDHDDCEFAGFAMVEQWDTDLSYVVAGTEDASNWTTGLNSEPAHTKAWYHTGVLSHDELRVSLAREYHRPLTRQATRALRGTLLREEVSAGDASLTSSPPYQINDHASTIKILQRCLRSGVMAVIHKSDRESVVTNVERQTNSEPKISHSMVLARDKYGRVTEEAQIHYGRNKPDLSLSATDQNIQGKTTIEYTFTEFTKDVYDPGRVYRLPAPLSMKKFAREITLNKDKRYVPSEIRGMFKDSESKDSNLRQLVSHTEIRYRKDDLTDVTNTLESLALPGAAYHLCLTPQMLAEWKPPTKLQDPALWYDTLIAEGGYVNLKQDGNLWVKENGPLYHPQPGATPKDELALASSAFFSPRRFVDNYGNVSKIDWDSFYLTPTAMINALNEGIMSITDYRVLQPRQIIDINGNQTRFAFDPLGNPTATAVSGKGGEGDSLDQSTIPLSQDQINTFFDDPLAAAPRLLGKASTRVINDIWSFSTNGRKSPVRTAQISREVHASTSVESPVQIVIDYIDGFGRSIQKKAIAEAAQDTPNISRWRCTAWQVLNNKGLVVENFEPFFDNSSAFVLGRKEGVSTLHAYDAMSREVVTISPNRTWTKSIPTPWDSTVYDASDTLELPLEKDVYAMSFLKDLSEDRLSPSWLEHRMTLPDGNREKQAAKQSQAYGCTPSTTHIDAKGRPFLVQKKLTDSQNTFVRTVFNHVDKPAKIQDTGGRFVSATSYDLLGRQIHQLALDSGESWMLHTASGEAFQTFNDHGGRLRNVYDKLRRNIAVFCRTASTSKEYMMTKTTYGSSSEFNNKGHVVRNYDQSGLTSTPHWDFKGNCLSKDVQLAKQYSTELDWQRDNPLEDAIYRTACRYDALNRITSCIAPDETVTKTTYLRGGLVGSTQVNIRSEKDVKGWKWKSVTSNKQYDAHARLISETQGNGTVVKVEFDPLTQATSRRQAQLKGVVLQDISFTRDVQQRITYASRTSQVPDIVRLAGSADSAYVYDALGRLIKSTGREDIAQSKGRPDAPGTEGLKADSTGMRRYTEDYTYDIYNNMLSIDHKIEDPKYSGWLRKMTYAEQTILGETFTGNRLATSTIGKTTEKYEYDSAGNTISMPHLSKVSWDILNHMRSSATQMTSSGVPETTWYVYNSAGERTRKVTERYRSANEPVRKLSEHIYIDGFDVYREYGGRGVETKSCESVRVLESEQPLLIIEHWSDRGSTPLMRYPIADEHSSISLELDDTGQMISYEEYSGFGGTTHRTLRKNIPKPFRFATKRRDQETSLYYFGGRYYAPWLCRWMSPDPSGLVDGTNTYIYCGADPVNHVDPDG
ncbi:SpvB-domain-containing protein, partial [Dissoconium aciculare CBS 342.82]|uniref:SpvB-domain-containing protein n=1 Tax=Dissoconium aciculare CBS 342.82 TaxID=1314786 RepID=A0A6J3M5K2_9PEZI